MKLSIEAPENDLAKSGEIHLHIRFRPANFVGIVIVLIIHALLLYFLLNMHPVKKKKQGDDAASQNPIVLMLDKATVAKMAAPEPKKPVSKPVVIPRPKKSIVSPVTPPVAPVQMAQTTVTPPTPIVQAPPEQDMMSMLNAARERRRAQEQSSQESAVNQSARGMSPQEVAEANVRRSMQQANGREGTGGVFQITSKSLRMATFTFRGWKPDRQNSFKKTIEVDAGLGGDIEIAIIRRMIVLIREEYQGDFSWESHRLGRVVTLSARPQDTAELENFMMKEFFGNGR